MLKTFQKNILEKIAKGCSVEETADSICRQVEGLASGAICSILTLDSSGRLHPLAAPSLPDDYSAALDGLLIGPGVGSCGTAAYRAEPVTVIDIRSDPLWASFKSLPPPNLVACWSSPIIHGDGRVLGVFAFYFTESRGPTAQETAIVMESLDLCSIMLEREEVRAANHRLAYFDSLTGLRNRASYNMHLERIRSTGHEGVVLVLIDLDHLKHVNDTFGHAAGDDLIGELARRIADCAAPGLAFRIGGDEFAVVASGNEAHLAPARIAEAIRRETGRPIRCGDHVLAATVTCGGAVCDPRAPCDFQTLQQRADLALYHAKSVARGGFALYDEALASTITRRFRAIQDVRTALAEHRLVPFYQPIVRLDTGDVIGLEALCRIRLSDGRVVAAADFAEAMQDLAVGRLVTERMLARVAQDIRSWLDQGIPIQHVGVNVAMADFCDGDLHARISAALERYDVPLKHLILEVNESVYMGRNDSSVAHAIERLRDEGLLVALDDFGTGYASLTHLLTFPVDIIKIDRSFVDRINEGDSGQVIIKGLLDIARGLGMRVVAEGVERDGQALQLGRLGCVFGQGYLFGRPADVEATTRLLHLRAQKLAPAQETVRARVA